MKKPKIVYIEWVDSSSPSNGWHRMENWSGLQFLHVISAGALIKKTKSTIVVAAALITDKGNEQASGVVTIPRVAIQKMKYLAG